MPRSGLPLTKEAPAPPAVPAEGEFEAVDARDVTLVVRAGKGRVALRGWCRIGVWTTLAQTRAKEFVIRESWGRLGERKPRRLRRIRDQALAGVTARLRPEADGTVSFVVEVAAADTEAARAIGTYHEQEVTLGDPRRHGYLFRGAAPAGWTGAVARWGDVACYLGDDRADDAPPNAVAFRAGKERGFVAGSSPRAEAFAETWSPMTPVRFEADGVDRVDYRLVRDRAAAGFSGKAKTYGADFTFD